MTARLRRHLFEAAALCVLLCPAAQAQRRTIMEGLAASSNAIYISTVSGSVFVTTAGTMTVAGNAFSVGASTLAVAGGRVGVGTTAPGTILHIASGTLTVNGTAAAITVVGGSVTANAFFGNGSALTGIATGASLTSTQTFSGANTFVSSVTAGPTAYTAAATVNSGVYVNAWMIVASTNPSAAHVSTFTALVPGVRYRISYFLTKNTAGDFRVRFNGDLGTNYDASRITTTGGTNDIATTEATLLDTAIGDTFQSEGSFEFFSPSNLTGYVSGHGLFSVRPAGGNINSMTAAIQYTGVSALSSINFRNSAGTMTGWITLEALIKPAGVQ